MAKFCSWCGEPLEPGARYCAECGARVLETVKVTGKGDADPMRGLDIVAGRPIPASKTTKLDRETLEALKLRDGLPGDDEPAAAPTAVLKPAHKQPSGGLSIPEVVEVPEIVELPEIDEPKTQTGQADAEAAKGAENADGDTVEAAAAQASEPAKAAASVGGDGADGVVEPEKDNASDGAVEPAGLANDPDAHADAEAEERVGGSNGVAIEGNASATPEQEAKPQSDAGASGSQSDLPEALDETSSGESEAGDERGEQDDLRPEQPDSAQQSELGSEPPEPASDFAAEPEEEHEAVPVIPREAQAAAAKPGPMSFDGTDTLVLPSDNEPKHFGLDRPDLKARKRKRMLIALCCVIAVLAVAACVLAYYRFGGASDSASNQPEPETQSQEAVTLPDESEQRPVADAPEQSAETEPLAKEEQAPTDEQVFQTLSSAYAALDGYSDRIVACVDEFNGLYMARSMDDRTAAKAKADKVKSDLEAAKAEIENLKVGANSPYATDEANMVELYECQIGRIASLADAWAVSVQYDVPSQHQDEILAALAASYQGGTNVYLERYDELYPYAKPVQK